MPTIAKEHQQKLENDVHHNAHNPGVIAARDWLYARQDALNRKWYALSGEDLTKAQGEAQLTAEFIRVIEKGPKISLTEERSE